MTWMNDYPTYGWWVEPLLNPEQRQQMYPSSQSQTSTSFPDMDLTDVILREEQRIRIAKKVQEELGKEQAKEDKPQTRSDSSALPSPLRRGRRKLK